MISSGLDLTLSTRNQGLNGFEAMKLYILPAAALFCMLMKIEQ